MKTFEKGKLYQVYTGKDWIIAEYSGPIPSHVVRGFRSTDGATSWCEPDMHYWKEVTGGCFRLEARGMQTRDVTTETLRQIEELKSKIDRLGRERAVATKELRDLCS